MKRIISAALLLLMYCSISAQSQELQQLKLDLEKLAQLKAMLSEMKQGYQVLQHGYNKIAATTQDNFDLHKSFLDAQLKPGAVVTKSDDVNKIFSNQKLLASEFLKAVTRFERSGLFSLTQLAEIKEAGYLLLGNMNAEIERLKVVLQEGSVRMTDAERLVEIDHINAQVTLQAEQLRLMTQRNERILAWRTQEKKDINALRHLKGL